MSCSINKLKSHMLFTCKNFGFPILSEKKNWSRKWWGGGRGFGAGTLPPPPPCWPFLCLRPCSCLHEAGNVIKIHPVLYAFFGISLKNTNLQHSENIYQVPDLKNCKNSVCICCTYSNTKQLLSNFQPYKSLKISNFED